MGIFCCCCKKKLKRDLDESFLPDLNESKAKEEWA